jgi:hypothetical protein
MRWFCALAEESPRYAEYAEMVKIAVVTAKRNTKLIPYFIFDGNENELTSWLRRQSVEVVHRRIPFYNELIDLSIQLGKPEILHIGAGAFLRTTIQAIAEEQHFADESLLYTDCDVMFTGEIVPQLLAHSTKYFAVAPESNPKDRYNINTGVMLMNLKGLGGEERNFQQFLSNYLAAFVGGKAPVFDQTAYEYYYRPLTRFLMQHNLTSYRTYRLEYHFAKIRKPLWDRLPLEFNWKPYWGENDAAKIIHFHGPKPNTSWPFDHSHFRPPSFDYWKAIWLKEFNNLP